MTTPFIKKCREAEEGVTEGPWEKDGGGFVVLPLSDFYKPTDRIGMVEEAEDRWKEASGDGLIPADAKFIAFARNNWTELLDRLEAAEKVIDYVAITDESDLDDIVFKNNILKAREYLERFNNKEGEK